MDPAQEGRIILAIQAIKLGQIQSIRNAAKTYNIPRTTLRRRIDGTTVRQDKIPNGRILTEFEESAIIQYVLDLDSRGFSPRPAELREMADLLLSERGGSPTGKCWTTNFIKRHQEITTKYNRKYDYKRALCEDPDIIRKWFQVVQNVIAKYGILTDDIFNFDEAGFLMGVIGTAKVVTSSESRNRPKCVQSGSREWATIIMAICAAGWMIPPFVIFKGKVHMHAWYKEDNIPLD